MIFNCNALIAVVIALLAHVFTAGHCLAAERKISVCLTPWWENWRLPTSCHSDFPLTLISPEERVRPEFDKWEKFEAWAYQQSVVSMERAGIDIVCWDTFGDEQIRQCGSFIQALKARQSPVRVVPYLDIHEATRPNEDRVVNQLQGAISKYRALPDFDAYWADPYYYTWGTRNLSPAIWERVLKRVGDAGISGKWVAHVNVSADRAKTFAANKDYLKHFDGLYSWQPARLSEISAVEGNLSALVDQFAGGNSRYIASGYPMFRRYGYGIGYVEPHGFQVFKTAWEQAIKLNASEMHLVTWNDYEEATIIEPTVSRGHCLVDLNRIYAEKFKSGRHDLPATRIFAAYPRGAGEGEPAYVDVTGAFADADVPCTVTIVLRNTDGRIAKEFASQTIHASGIQSIVESFDADQSLGKGLRPEIRAVTRSGRNLEFASSLPWMNIYDAGALRERSVWMVEASTVSTDIKPLVVLDQAGQPLADNYQKKIRLSVQVPQGAKYVVLKRNGELAAIVHGSKAYFPTASVGGDWGWTAYEDVKINGQEMEFSEPQSKYSLPSDGGGVSKVNRYLTGYPRDWYSVVVVDSQFGRHFSPPVVVTRRDADDTVVRYNMVRSTMGCIRDDTLKGFDIKDFGGTEPVFRTNGSDRALLLDERSQFLLPNELLSLTKFAVEFDIRQIAAAPAALLWCRSGEFQLYVDAANHLVVRRADVAAPGQYIQARSATPLKPGQNQHCMVRVMRGEPLAVTVDGVTRQGQGLVQYLDYGGFGVQLARPLPAEVSGINREGGRFQIELMNLRISALKK